jgi:hypothetical protein
MAKRTIGNGNGECTDVVSNDAVGGVNAVNVLGSNLTSVRSATIIVNGLLEMCPNFIWREQKIANRPFRIDSKN